jgi:diguanylate cyclase (GGDEF)-like protein/PAS domain S-box-containing protein
MEQSAPGINKNQQIDALIESGERFKLIFEHAPIGMLITDLKGRFVKVNQALADLLAFPKRQLATMSFNDITHPEDLKKDLALVGELVKGKRNRFVMEKRYIRSDGEIIHVTLHVSLVRDLRGRPRYFIAQIVDITDRKHLEQTMRHLAYHDPLTGLPNRILFRDQLGMALAKARNQKHLLAVVFLDLDRFKKINDTLGHGMGDQALRLIADRLTNSVRSTDVVARLGGDEFTVMLSNVNLEKDVFVVLEKIIATLEEPLILKNQEFSVSASVGIALHPRDGHDIDTLLQVADQAMYASKRRKGIEI